MSGRAAKILSSWPAHLEAANPDKRLDEVVASLSGDLDQLASDLGGVRRAHRLGEARVLRDLERLGAMHGLRDIELTVLFARFRRAGELLANLDEAIADADDGARDAAAEELIALWGVAAPSPRLPLFAPEPQAADPPDLAAAAANLAGAARLRLGYRELSEAVRRRIARLSALHASGNGTVEAVLQGAANALDLVIGPIAHSTDRFRHAAIANDAMSVGSLPVAGEVIGLEENPERRETRDQLSLRHRDLFSINRRGFGEVTLRVRISGRESHTVGPMLVNRDQGRGIGFTGSVAAGEALEFTEDGRVLLGEEDVTGSAFVWDGACFAGRDASAESDFVFGGDGVPAVSDRQAGFAVSTPAAALDADTEFPHEEAPLPVLGMGIGTTRFAFFIQEGHHSSLVALGEPPTVERVQPRPTVGFLDGSVAAPELAAGKRPLAANLELSWLEREAYSLKLWIPQRFAALDDDGGEAAATGRQPPVPVLVREAVRRFKPAGVDVRVEYIDDRWVLGEGSLSAPGEAGMADWLLSGTRLSSEGAEDEG